MSALAEMKLSQIAMPLSKSEGIVYIKNYGKADLSNIFKEFGEIKSIDLIDNTYAFPIRAIHFNDSKSAFLAAKAVNGRDDMIVGAIASCDARHNLFIRNCFDSLKADQISQKIFEIAQFHKSRLVNNNLVVKMNNLVDAQTICALFTAEGFRASFICDETAFS